MRLGDVRTTFDYVSLFDLQPGDVPDPNTLLPVRGYVRHDDVIVMTGRSLSRTDGALLYEALVPYLGCGWIRAVDIRTSVEMQTHGTRGIL